MSVVGDLPNRDNVPESVCRRQRLLSAAAGRELRQLMERPERDQREVAAEVTRPDAPGGEQR